MFKKIFWVGMSSPQQHGIGDHAQTLAINRLLQKNYKDSEIIRIDRSETKRLFNEKVKKSDLILINSAGDFGDWCIGGRSFHDWRRRIVRKFPENRIVQLPVTIYYNKMSEFELDKQLFGNHKKFLLMARDLISYSIVKENFECKTIFHPDFVFSLKLKYSKRNRKGIIAVLRKDMESHFNDRFYLFLRSHRKTSFIGKGYYHTVRRIPLNLGISKAEKVIDNVSEDFFSQDIQVSTVDITDKNREKIVLDTINFYRKFSVTITDRFHGFVFSSIAKTPCIALIGGIPHKIKGYKSMFNKTLKFANSINDIPKLVKLDVNRSNFKKTVDFSKYFDNFKKMIELEFDNFPKEQSYIQNDVFNIIKNRRSVRRWTKKQVESQKLKIILEAGVYAPSAGNIQANRFLVVNDKEKIKFLCKNTCPWFMVNFPTVIIAVLYDLEKAKNRGFDFTKPHKWDRFVWQDSSAAIENMLIMAKALGIETCWVSIPPKKRRLFNIRKYSAKEKRMREVLQINERYFLTSMVFMGYSDSCGNLKSRHQGFPIKRNFNDFILNNDFVNIDIIEKQKNDKKYFDF
jgi:exopolysaccharide biosynthesis predicted pyruvyltransferase EpsI/nitroreductase